MAFDTRIQHKIDTAAGWEGSSITLLDGELALVKIDGKVRLKVGDGSSTYASLPFFDQDASTHIANKNNPHGVTKEQLNLDKVNNTADSEKTVKAANALTVVSKGSATKPVYFNSSGVPVACTYSLNADVPSGAKFTDTVYTHPSHTAKSSGLYKITVDSLGHVSAATAVAKSDITGLGIPAQDTVYTHPSTHAASMITGLATVATSGSYNDLSNKPTIPTSLPANGGNSDTVNGHTVLSDVPEGAVFTDTIYTLPAATTSALGGVKVGTNISVSSGTISVANGSTSTKGVVKLSSSTSSTSTSLAATASAVKAAYDLAAGKQSPSTTLSGYGITDAYTKTEVDNKVAGLVDSAPEALNTLNELAAALGNDANFSTTISTLIGQKADASALAKVATSGSYNDLSNKPTIPTSLPANGGNAATVGGFTVGCNVPADAVFTDTKYTLPAATTSALGGVKVGTNISVSSGTISVANGSTSAKGVVQLTNSTSSTSTTTAATPSAVKSAYDLAASKQSPATTLSGYGITNAYTKTEVDNGLANKLNTSGGNVTGHVYLTGAQANSSTSNTSQIVFGTADDNHVAISSNNNALVINPDTASTNNQIVLYLDKASMFPNGISGNASSATKLTSSAGSATQPIYFSNGKPAACTYTLEKSVPSDAKFTDTVYTHPTYTAKSSGLYKITVNSLGHVSAASAVAKSDITGLGIPAQDTTYSAATTSTAGLMSAADKTKLDGIATGANAYSLPTASSSTLGGVKTTSNVTSTSGLTACPIISGVPYYKNTTYSTATTSADGLMSSSDKSKLNGIASGANAYTHPSHTAKSSGLYKITVDALGHVSAATAVAKADITGLGIPAQDTVYTHPSTHAASMITGLATVATSGSYNDLSNKPSIPTVTKVTFTATDSKWGALANGRYPLTISASGGEFLNCYRTNGSNYDKMDVNVTVSGNNIIIYSLDKFAGYMTYLK